MKPIVLEFSDIEYCRSLLNDMDKLIRELNNTDSMECHFDLFDRYLGLTMILKSEMWKLVGRRDTDKLNTTNSKE